MPAEAATKLIDLDRKLVVFPRLDTAGSTEVTSDLLIEVGLGDETTWKKLLESKRVILLIGPAHCGKTSELTLLKSRLLKEGQACFLMDMATLTTASVDEALGAASVDLQAWIAASDQAVIILDALDEAVLCDERALSTSLRKVCARLGSAGVRRARFVVSSRPGSWTSRGMLSEIREQLEARGADEPKQQPTIQQIFDASEEERSNDALVAVTLLGLQTVQIDTLLREAHQVSDPSVVLRQAWRLGLGFAVKSPGSLRWLVQVVKAVGDESAGRYAGLHALLGEQVRAAYELRQQRVSVPEAEFIQDLERLCAAAHFGGTFLFALRSAPNAEGAASLRTLLAHREARYESFVQSSPFFLDAGMQRIKWFPAELMPFLAARWLKRRIDRGELSADSVFEDLFVSASFAGDIVPSSFEVVAGWLASMSADFARRLLSVAPHAVLLYGDVGRLPPELALEAFEATKTHLLNHRALFYRSVRLTVDDFFQAMCPALEKPVLASFAQVEDNLEALDVLIRMVASRGVRKAIPHLRRILANPKTSLETLPRLVDAIGECGGAEDVEWAVDHLFQTNGMSNRVATRCFESLLQRSPDVDRLRKVVATGHLDQIAAGLYAEDFIYGQPDMPSALALMDRLFQACVAASARSADDDADAEDAELQAIPSRILAAALRGVLSRSDIGEADYKQLLLWLEMLRGCAPESATDLFEDIEPLIARMPDFRHKALLHILANASPEQIPWLRGRDTATYVRPTPADAGVVRQVQQATCGDRQDALERLATWLELKPAPTAKPTKKEPPKWADPLVEKAKAALESIRSASELPLLQQLVDHILRADHSDGDYGWKHLRSRFGDEVTEAARAGFRRLWRTHAPQEDENNPSTRYHQTLGGLIGLRDELSEPLAVNRLNTEEVTRALEYSLFESGSFPDWVSQLLAERFDLCDEFFAAKIASWQASPAARQHARDAISWMPDALARDGVKTRRAVRAYWQDDAWDGHYDLERVLRVLLMRPEIDLAEEIGFVAEVEWSEGAEGRVALMSAWMRLRPAEAIDFLASAAADPQQRADLINLSSYWSRSDSVPIELEGDSSQLAANLERLYLVVSTAVPPGQDPHKVNVYTTDSVDDAISLRSSLLQMMEKMGGHAAYDALMRLAEHFRNDPNRAKVYITVATKVAEQAVLPAPWSTQEFVEFAQKASELPVSSESALWRRVRRDVKTAIENLQHGRLSVARMLERGGEPDMQLWLARELELLSGGAYSVHRESQLSNRSMPDVLASASDKQVTLELKVGDKRNLESLKDDLEYQLVEDYLADVRSNHGAFVVMLKDRQKRFPNGNRYVTGPVQLQATLQRHAEDVAATQRRRKLVEVLVFACPVQRTANERRKAAKRSAKRTP